MARVLFVPERDDAHPFSLRKTAKIRNRDARHTIDRVDAVEFERVDDEMKAVRQCLRCGGIAQLGINALRCC